MNGDYRNVVAADIKAKIGKVKASNSRPECSVSYLCIAYANAVTTSPDNRIPGHYRTGKRNLRCDQLLRVRIGLGVTCPAVTVNVTALLGAEFRLGLEE